MTKLDDIVLKTKKPQGDINPVFEEELVKVLQQIWDNRFNVSHSMLKILKHVANKKS
jgi:hypothetical protein